MNNSVNFNNPIYLASEIKNEQGSSVGNIVTKPIDTVENIVTNTVDTFTPKPKDEETKHTHKTAIRVVSTVLVLSALIPLLNPKFSSKWIEKMRTASAKYRAKKDNANTFVGKIYDFAEAASSKSAKVLNFANNWNPFKDEIFKWLCKKSKILKKPHEFITQGFDKISKQTVYRKYKKTQSSFSALDNAITQYRKKLPKSEADRVDKLVKQALEQQKYFSSENISSRLKTQENLMANLEASTIRQMKYFGKGFLRKQGKVNHLKKNFKFWAEDILMPQRNKVEADGLNTIQAIIGDGKSQKGTYNEILEIITPHVKENEKAVLEELLSNASKRLKSANKTECTEYFNKKRDLMLGSAPTDILTALFGLGASGIAIGKADTKEDRISRGLTVAFPAVAGLGVSMGMAAMLYSGIKGMLIGSVSSGLLSLTGSEIDKKFIHKSNENKEEKNA